MFRQSKRRLCQKNLTEVLQDRSFGSFTRTWTNGGIRTSLPTGVSGSCSSLDPFVPNEWQASDVATRTGKLYSYWLYRETAQHLQLFPGPGGVGPAYELPEDFLHTRAKVIPLESGVVVLVAPQKKKVLVHGANYDTANEDCNDFLSQTAKGFNPLHCRYNAVTGQILPFNLQAKTPQSRQSDSELPGVFNVICSPGNFLIPRSLKSLWVSKESMQEYGWWSQLKVPESQLPDNLKITVDNHRDHHGTRVVSSEEELGAGGGYFHVSCFGKKAYDILADVSTKTHFCPLMHRLRFGSGLRNLHSLPNNIGWNSEDYQILQHGVLVARPGAANKSSNGTDCVVESLASPDLTKELRRIADKEGYQSRRWVIEEDLDQTKNDLTGCGLAHTTREFCDAGSLRSLSFYNRDQFSGKVGDDDLLSLQERVAQMKHESKRKNSFLNSSSSTLSPMSSIVQREELVVPASTEKTKVADYQETQEGGEDATTNTSSCGPQTAEEEEELLKQKVEQLKLQVDVNNSRVVELEETLRNMNKAWRESRMAAATRA